mgnify:FL=1
MYAEGERESTDIHLMYEIKKEGLEKEYEMTQQ